MSVLMCIVIEIVVRCRTDTTDRLALFDCTSRRCRVLQVYLTIMIDVCSVFPEWAMSMFLKGSDWHGAPQFAPKLPVCL